MPDIGVRELKTHASAIVRSLREQRARYVVTYRGQPIGLLVPLDEVAAAEGSPAINAWAELTRLGQEIGREWISPLTGAEILSEMRR